MEIINRGSFSAFLNVGDDYFITAANKDKLKLEYYDDVCGGMLEYDWCPKVEKIFDRKMMREVQDLLDSTSCFQSYSVDHIYKIELLSKIPDNYDLLKMVACTKNGCNTRSRWYNKDFYDCMQTLEELCMKYETRLDPKKLFGLFGEVDIPVAKDVNGCRVYPTTELNHISRIRNVLWRGNQFVIADPFLTVG